MLSKKGVRYRYYISAPLNQGQPDKAAKLNRVPAIEIGKPIIGAVREHLGANPHNEVGAEGLTSLSDKELISTHIARVDVSGTTSLSNLLSCPNSRATQRKQRPLDYKNGSEQGNSGDHGGHNYPSANILVVPWKKTPSKRPRQIIPPAATSSRQDPRPIRAETRAKLVTATATARQWLDEFVTGTVKNVEQIADREKCSIRQVNRTITLAFLAPALVQAAVDGRLPRGIGVATLRDLPAEWTRQYELLGLMS
jgi:site-specific DNA recombinase